jgi:hypothetical protein
MTLYDEMVSKKIQEIGFTSLRAKSRVARRNVHRKRVQQPL